MKAASEPFFQLTASNTSHTVRSNTFSVRNKRIYMTDYHYNRMNLSAYVANGRQEATLRNKIQTQASKWRGGKCPLGSRIRGKNHSEMAFLCFFNYFSFPGGDISAEFWNYQMKWGTADSTQSLTKGRGILVSYRRPQRTTDKPLVLSQRPCSEPASRNMELPDNGSRTFCPIPMSSGSTLWLAVVNSLFCNLHGW